MFLVVHQQMQERAIQSLKVGLLAMTTGRPNAVVGGEMRMLLGFAVGCDAGLAAQAVVAIENQYMEGWEATNCELQTDPHALNFEVTVIFVVLAVAQMSDHFDEQQPVNQVFLD